MKYKTQWTHYCAFSDETGPFVTSSHNSSILLFEKKDWWKVICIKIKGIKKMKKKKQKGLDRVQNISWFERYMTTHLVAAAQMNFVSMIFASRTLEENLQLNRSPQTPSTRRYLFSILRGFSKRSQFIEK